MSFSFLMELRNLPDSLEHTISIDFSFCQTSSLILFQQQSFCNSFLKKLSQIIRFDSFFCKIHKICSPRESQGHKLTLSKGGKFEGELGIGFLYRILS